MMVDVLLYLVICIATLIACEIAIQAPLRSALGELLNLIQRSYKTIKSSKISDHWKETILPIYSLRMFKASFLLICLILLIAAPFALAILFLDAGNIDLMKELESTQTILSMTGLAILYIWLRINILHG